MGVCSSDNNNIHELENNSFFELPMFTYNNLETAVRVVSVHDGDTVTVIFYHNNIPIKNNFRMFGYDCPELKPSLDFPHRELHVKAAIIAKHHLRNLLLDKVVMAKFTHEDKYGRLMGYLFSDNSFNIKNSFNQHMIDEKFGKPYNGGHKLEFTEKELFDICNKKSNPII